MINQSVWREGLPDPDYERIITEVRNIIIHHTAGSNEDSDYILVVRNIYIFHTEIRGWSDIGYNYLIAQDGTIFKGRDPGTGEQDNVMGAHFCASNSGTMGISLLGTYTDIAPPDTALKSLIRLLTWKAGKDSLDPIGIYPHTLNAELPLLAGHRDGCATECPGEILYGKLSEIRNTTLADFEACNFYIKPPTEIPVTDEDSFPVLWQLQGEIYIRWSETYQIELYTLLGQKVNFDVVDLSENEKKITVKSISGCNLIAVATTNFYRYTKMIYIP